jgi:Glycosyltransferase family 92
VAILIRHSTAFLVGRCCCLIAHPPPILAASQGATPPTSRAWGAENSPSPCSRLHWTVVLFTDSRPRHPSIQEHYIFVPSPSIPYSFNSPPSHIARDDISTRADMIIRSGNRRWAVDPKRFAIAAFAIFILLTISFSFGDRMQATKTYMPDLSFPELDLDRVPGYKGLTDSLSKTTSEFFNPTGEKTENKDGELDAAPFPPLPPGDDEEYVAICMAVRNQSLDLPEVLSHHYHHLGVRRFYIMDDGTIPPLEEYPDYGVPRSALTFQYFNESERVHRGMQYKLYNSCIGRFGDKHKWIGFLDADEFLEMTNPQDTLVSLLKEFEGNTSIGAVGVNWITHTSNGLIDRPASNRASQTECVFDDPKGENRHIKSFVRPHLYRAPSSPHSFKTKNDTFTVGETGDFVKYAFRRPITRDRWALHHYAVKSKQEFEEKLARKSAMDNSRGWGFWEKIHNVTTMECKSLQNYYP